MDSTLLKKLKDSGFPFPKEKASINYYPHPFLGRMITPSLEELIQACGKGFKALEKDSVAPWYALGITVRGQGSSPIEAVAMLYIALNSK